MSPSEPLRQNRHVVYNDVQRAAHSARQMFQVCTCFRTVFSAEAAPDRIDAGIESRRSRALSAAVTLSGAACAGC